LKNFYRSPFSKWPPQYRTNSTLGLKNKSKATFEIEQCWIFAVLWWPFWKWRPVEIFRCQESIQDVEIEQCRITGIELGESILIFFFLLFVNIYHWFVISAIYSNYMPFMYLFNVANCNLKETSSVCLTCV
jgi:hypothetical protein